ncbi:hypothetical protein [Lysobacter gummosus]|uniref:hypothetical protein n=1 Tax=Lysobacter gummosus TaxID=262324 RepID=UPI0036410290
MRLHEWEGLQPLPQQQAPSPATRERAGVRARETTRHATPSHPAENFTAYCPATCAYYSGRASRSPRPCQPA